MTKSKAKTVKKPNAKADPLAAFNFHEGSDRDCVLRALYAKLGKPVPVAALKKVADNVSDPICVIPLRAKRLKLPFTLLKSGKGDDRAVTLKRTGRA